ncbi:MAG: chorismate synthase [Candidatus Dormibacteraceae bacterium]
MRWFTAGESHGPQLTVIMEGLPAGIEISSAELRGDLARRQGGYGRGGRQQIETDQARLVGGVRGGVTLGSPVALVLENKDHEHWLADMSPEAESFKPRRAVTKLRPGHADLAGSLKYGYQDVRNVLERSSARETAGRVAAGGVARKLLATFGISIFSFTRSIGEIRSSEALDDAQEVDQDAVERSPVRCPDPVATKAMIAAIDAAREAGDTLGGTFTVVATGVPPGIGSHVHWDRKLDGRLAMAVISINAVKAVEFGAGFAGISRPGSAFHDQIEARGRRFRHLSNRAGGITGGMSNGEPIEVTVGIKPIATLKQPLQSVDLISREPVKAHFERSDVCVVPAAGVIGEAMVALTLADSFLEKFGGDSVTEIRHNVDGYLEGIGWR